MALIDEVKVALRTTSDDEGLLQEAQTLVDAAILDLQTSGILEDKITAIDDDALLRQCVIFYAKGYYGYDNADADRYQAAYDRLKTLLCSKEDYISEDEDEDE